jgi:hypothetical protein
MSAPSVGGRSRLVSTQLGRSPYGQSWPRMNSYVEEPITNAPVSSMKSSIEPVTSSPEPS